MRLTLWRYFIFYSVVNAATLSITFGSIALLAPLYTWLFTHELKWATFQQLLGYVLLGMIIGVMVGGIMTLHEWTQRTAVSVKRKIFIVTIASCIIAVSMYAAIDEIKRLLVILHQ